MKITITISPEDYICLKRIEQEMENKEYNSGIIQHILTMYEELLEQSR